MQVPRRPGVGALLIAGLFSFMLPLRAAAGGMSAAPISVMPDVLSVNETRKAMEAPAEISNTPNVDIGRGIFQLGLAEKNPGFPYLDESIDSYRQALTKMSRDTPRTVVLQTKSDLAYALNRRAQKSFVLTDAVEAEHIAESALAQTHHASEPEEWSRLQALIGSCLVTQNLIDNNVETARKSIAAFQAAQEIDSDSHATHHWLAVQYRVANMLFFIAGRTKSHADVLTAEHAYSELAATAGSLHEKKLMEYSLSGLARTKRNQGVIDDDPRLLAEAIDMFTQQAERISATGGASFLTYTQINIAYTDILLFERTQDPEMLERAEARYRDSLAQHAEMSDPDLNSRVALFLSAHTLQESTQKYDPAKVVEALIFDERALATLPVNENPELYGLLKEQVGIAGYLSAAADAQPAKLHAALDAFAQAAAINPSRKDNALAAYYQAEILGKLADLEHSDIYEHRSNLLFGTLSVEFHAQSVQAAIESAWSEHLLRHAIAFEDIESAQKAMTLIRAALSVSEPDDHALRASLHSDLASGLILIALNDHDESQLRAAVTERRAALTELEFLPKGKAYAAVRHLLGVNLLQLGLALTENHDTQPGIEALRESIVLLRSEAAPPAKDRQSAWTENRSHILDALNALSWAQPDNVEAALDAIAADREYLSAASTPDEPRRTALLQVEFGNLLERAARLTGNETLRREARSVYAAALPRLDPKNDADSITLISKKLGTTH